MLYIEKLYLKGYRTIQGLSTTLRPGLNIIIGKNGTGKTNFMQFLAKVLRFTKVDIPEFSSTLTLKNEGKEDVWKLSIENFLRDDSGANGYIVTDNQTIRLEENGKERDWSNPFEYPLFTTSPQKLLLVFVKHGLPEDYVLVDKPFEFTFSFRGIFASLANEITDSNRPHFLKGLFINISFSLRNNFKARPNYGVGIDHEILKETLSQAFQYVEQLKQPLSKFSNIKDLRFSEGYIFSDFTENSEKENPEKGNSKVSNLYLEFYVNNRWLPFRSLSDGTQRLFYIISEIATKTYFTYSSEGFGIQQEEQPVIILLEEPELGIHPQLLFNLMQFLKESSLNKQIILTTHSPQVLDVINHDELDRIFIAKLEHGKTVLNHLTEEQKEKAADYMQSEAYLSDYWKYSDLED